MADALRDYLIINSFIENIYVYYPNSNLVVGNIGCFSANSYYTLQGYPDSSGYLKWINSLNSAKGISIQELSYQNRQNFCYVHTMKTSNSIKAIMVFEIKYDQLLQDFEPGDTADVLTIGILQKENLIASVGNQDSLEKIDTLYSEWANSGRDIVELNDMYAFFYPSTIFDFTYVTIYTARQLTQSLYFPPIVALTGVILCIIIGISGAVYISVRNGRPMENILTVLGKKSTSANEDYQFILSKFEQMTEEKYKSEEFIQEHQTLLNSIFLSSLLQEDYQNENEIFAEAKRYEVSFEAPIYQIIILASIQEKVPNYALKTGILHNDLEKLEYSSLITTYHHRYVILFNTDEPIPEHELTPIIKAMQKHAFPEHPSQAAVGSWCDNMVGISRSYHNALNALRGINAKENSSIVYYKEANEYSSQGNTDLMKMFISLIYSKQFHQARQLLPQLSEEYLYCANTQTEFLRQNALTNIIVDSCYITFSQIQAAKEADALMNSTNSKENYLQQIDIILQHLQNCTNIQNDCKTPIAVQAKQFIDDNYTDSMMGLYLVSDRLGISNSYLSATFKKVYGINIIQYINQLRIERAKVLILTTRKNIKEIAQDVGFSSDINFIRVFKKMENQTPSMLRKQSNQ